MLRRFIAFSLDRPLLILAVSVAVMGWVLSELPRRPMDVFPEVESPTVVVLSECQGLSAVEVEQYVTLPLESALHGLPGILVVRSGSALGFSLIQVQFDWGTDIYLARQMVQEALTTVSDRLPPETHTELSPIAGILGEIMLVSVSADPEAETPASALELREYAEFDLGPRLLAVRGVSQVVSLGGELPEYQVVVDPDALREHDVDLHEVVEAGRRSTSTEAAGYLPSVRGREMAVRQHGQALTVEEIGRTLVQTREGARVTLSQVAEVRRHAAPARGTASENGHDAVVLGIKKAPSTNTLEVTAALDEALDQARATLPEGMVLNPHVMRQADFIQKSLDNVRKVLTDAALFVTIVLVLFLMNLRTCVITLLALPLSLAVAVAILWGTGLGLNVMTLGGLAVALGELVDDAIIDVENVVRRLRENAARPPEQRRSLRDVVFQASNEIRSAVVFATAILALVLAPLLLLEGLEGKFFRPLALAYCAALGASLLVALSLTPVMCRLLLRRDAVRERRPSMVIRALERAYGPVLAKALRWRRSVLAVALVMTVLAVLLASTFGTSFLPEFNEGTFTVFLFAPPGTSLEESDRLASQVEHRLGEIEGVVAVVRRTGRAEKDAHAEPVSNSEIELRYSGEVDRAAVRAEIDEILGSMPGIGTQVGQPISHRLSHILSGTLAAIAVDLFGDDPAELREVAEAAAAAMRAIPDVRDVALPREALVHSVEIRYRAEDLTRWGLTRGEAAWQVRAAYSGYRVAKVFEGLRVYDLVVRYDEARRDSVEDVRELLLRSRDGTLVRLHEVADVGPIAEPMAIQHESLRRKATVSCNLAPGSDLGGVVEQIRAAVEGVAHPRGVSLRIGGQHEAQERASKRLLWGSLLVAAVVFALLTIGLRSATAAGVVMINLPLGLIGGVAAIYLIETPDVAEATRALLGGEGRYRPAVVSIASLVGFLTLFGIAVRGGILLVQRFRNLEDDGRSIAEAIVEGSRERLVPILMTAITAMLGLLPLALARGEPGSELLAPLAVVVLGGLVSATGLNLLVVPAAYSLVFDRGPTGDPNPARSVGDDSEDAKKPAPREPEEEEDPS